MNPEQAALQDPEFMLVWDELDPVLADQVLNGAWKSIGGSSSLDPAAARVLNRVREQIGQKAPEVARVAGDKPLCWQERLRMWSRSPYVRTAAAAILILSLVGVLLRPYPGPRPQPTIPATTQAATTAATTAGMTTKPATTAATTVATTHAGTTAATTAATTISPTGASQTGPTGAISWPIHLIGYLDFDQSQVASVQIRRLRSDGSFDQVWTVEGNEKIDRVFNLINQIHLEKPASVSLPPEGASYEMIFKLGVNTPDTPFLALKSHEGSGIITVHGSFIEILKVDAPNGLTQANPYLTFDEIAEQLDAIFE